MTADSITATVRIPDELAIKIDDFIEEFGIFSNRPDFITAAIRYHQEELIKLMKRAWNEVDDDPYPESKIPKYNGIMYAIRDEFNLDYTKYKGNVILIILRIPRRLKEQSLGISSNSTRYENFQKFVRIAIIRYYDYLQNVWEYNKLIQNNIDDCSVEISKIIDDILKKKNLED
jgi:Arc/MetJ-type ribon-helix-helix transcriptional regulator